MTMRATLSSTSGDARITFKGTRSAVDSAVWDLDFAMSADGPVAESISGSPSLAPDGEQTALLVRHVPVCDDRLEELITMLSAWLDEPLFGPHRQIDWIVGGETSLHWIDLTISSDGVSENRADKPRCVLIFNVAYSAIQFGIGLDRSCIRLFRDELRVGLSSAVE